MSHKILEFLKQLKDNNNREWFNSNKKCYEEARLEFKKIIDELLSAMTIVIPGTAGLESKDCIFRIYRDVRFSKDKRPYKTQMGAYLAPDGRKSLLAGHYLHIEPGNSFIAGGAYRPQSDYLKKMRMEIMYNTDEYLSIINNEYFVKLFGRVEGEKLKRPPIGFPTDYKHMDLIKFKDYTIAHPVPDNFFDDSDFIGNIMAVFMKMNDFLLFLNRSFD